MSDFTRAFALEDIHIRSGGDGRTVEAYAAVFDLPTPISDHQGRYLETISPTAFNKTIADKGTRFGVFYNHGLTIMGTPSDRGSLPIGTPEKVVADQRGLLTVTRYNNTPLADEVLEGIRTNAITAQSFSGRFISSDKKVPMRGFEPAADGSLTNVTRTEISLREYGPTPFPAYEAAAILGVRMEQFADLLRNLDQEQRAELLGIIKSSGSRSDENVESDSNTSNEAVADEPLVNDGEHSGRANQKMHLTLRKIAREKGVL